MSMALAPNFLAFPARSGQIPRHLGPVFLDGHRAGRARRHNVVEVGPQKDAEVMLDHLFNALAVAGHQRGDAAAGKVVGQEHPDTVVLKNLEAASDTPV